jgi:tetratricopeptide (TPR) repeat protein
VPATHWCFVAGNAGDLQPAWICNGFCERSWINVRRAQKACDVSNRTDSAVRRRIPPGDYHRRCRHPARDAGRIYLLGMALYNQGRAEEALWHLERSLDLGPDDSRPHNDMGIVLARLGRLSEAVNQYEAALRLRPAFPEAHNNLANPLMKLHGCVCLGSIRISEGSPSSCVSRADLVSWRPT